MIKKAISVLTVWTIIQLIMTTTDNDGIYSITLAFMSLWTSLLVIGSLGYKPEKPNANIPKWITTLVRVWVFALVLHILYNEYMAIGILWMVSFLTIYSKNKDDMEEKDGQS